MGAKRVRADLERAKMLFRLRKHVVASVAPSFAAEFADIRPEQLIAALRMLGFAAVSETALGAEEVSAAAAHQMETEGGLAISSACPVVVELIGRYYPQYSPAVCRMFSPVLAHCKLLRSEYGRDIGIVFFSPCIAKKIEADRNPDLLDVSLTFHEVHQWFQEEGIDPAMIEPGEKDRFVPRTARDGTLYPIDGGMLAGIRSNSPVTSRNLMAFSGISAIQRALEDLEDLRGPEPLFLELLACEGGCINGPQMHHPGRTVVKRSRVIGSFEQRKTLPSAPVGVPIEYHPAIEAVRQHAYSEEQIQEALKRVGKFGPEDELNCGGCGYDSCRHFAKALLDGRAEETMCMGYMRQLAQKQADALLRAMPSGVVIVDESLRILESNRRFSELMGPEAVRAYEARPHLTGAALQKMVPFSDLFAQVLASGAATLEKEVKVGTSIYHVTLFTIEKHRRVGGIIQDVTLPSVRKEQIINKAREVISRNLETVQKIAYLLGENAAESEVILNSIVEMFQPVDSKTPPSEQP
jgi:PAS domain-containing protein